MDTVSILFLLHELHLQVHCTTIILYQTFPVSIKNYTLFFYLFKLIICFKLFYLKLFLAI